MLALVCLIVYVSPLSAQHRKGLWFEFGSDLGATLNTIPTQLSDAQDNIYAALGATLGIHLPSLNGLQVGIGAHSVGYGNPSSLSFAGVHLDAKYNPLRKLKRLQLALRLGKPLVSGRTAGFAHFDSKFYSTLAIGWELDNILGFLGLTPAIGVSHSSFDYRWQPSGHGTTEPPLMSSTQTAIFVRLGILIN